EKHQSISLNSCRLVYLASKGHIVPCEYQLQSTDGLSDGLKILVSSGTGSGKTLCQIILILLYPKTTSMTIPPLK
ncbi:hypothetical protein C8R43DRAFT_848982, partial [Mycena crocata]